MNANQEISVVRILDFLAPGKRYRYAMVGAIPKFFFPSMSMFNAELLSKNYSRYRYVRIFLKPLVETRLKRNPSLEAYQEENREGN